MSLANALGVWDPIKVFRILNSDHNKNFTCSGWAPSKGRRCHNPINQRNRATAYSILKDLSYEQPRVEEIRPILRDLAKICLCVRDHRNQVDQVVRQWIRDIEDYNTSRRRTTYSPPSQSSVPSRRDSWDVRLAALEQAMERAVRHIESARPMAAQEIVSPAAAVPASATPQAAVRQTSSRQTNPPVANLGRGTVARNSAVAESSAASMTAQRTSQDTSPSASVFQTTTAPLRQFPSSSTLRNGTSTSASSVVDISSGASTPTAPTPQARTPSPSRAQAQAQAQAQPPPAVPARARTSSPVRVCRENHVARRPIDENCSVCTLLLVNDPLRQLVWCKAECGNSVHKACFEEWKRASSGRQLNCVICRANWQPPCEHDTLAPPYEMWSDCENLGLADLFDTYEECSWDVLCGMVGQPDDWRTWRVLAAMRDQIGSRIGP